SPMGVWPLTQPCNRQELSVMREWSGLRGSISGVSCRRVLRRVILAIVLMLAAGASLSTSAVALATPLGPWLPNPPIDVSSRGQDADTPQVATGPDGTTTITWTRYNDAGDIIVQAATRAANATTFSTPIDLSTTGGNAYYPQVATGPDGTTTITWERDDGSNWSVQAATRAANATTFSTPIDLSTTGQSTFDPQVATGPDGTTTITWERYDGSNWIVQAATRAANATTFSDPINLSATGQDANTPQVATGPDGTTTITWYLTGYNFVVQAATRAAGASAFSTPIDLSSTEGGEFSAQVQVAVGSDGTTTITWLGFHGGDLIVQAMTATPPPSVLTVTKTGNGTVTSTPANINCGTTCTATIANLTTVTLTATAEASTFNGWSGDCTGTSTCTVSMTQARNVTATFTPRTPTKIRWNTGTRTTNQPITGSFTAAPDTTYTITATRNATRHLETRATRTARGTCKVKTNQKTHKRTASCTIRLRHAGTWLVKITPTENGLVRTPATKTIKIHTPPPTRKPQPAEPITG
ncbi:MAG: hypothetical protein NTV52_00200, partial [Acidobacteria bacterium]|nr:hypothetical protein [Acidobacteriota bacterium]